MLLKKGPWSDSLGALVHGRGFYDQFDSGFWENKYRWCFDGDGGDGGGDGEGGGGVDDSGEVGGPGESPDDAGPDDSGEVGGYNSAASFDAISGASPGYGGPGVEGDLGSVGIDASPGYGGPGVEGPASLGYGFEAPEEEENSFFGSLLNSVLGSPVSALAGAVVGGPIGVGLGALANYAVEEAFGPSVATDTFGNTLGISSNNEGLGSAARDAVGIGSLSGSLGSLGSLGSFSSSSSETSGPGVGGDDVFLNQPLGLAALSPSTVLGVADTTNLNDVTPSWSPANFQQYSGIGGLRNV